MFGVDAFALGFLVTAALLVARSEAADPDAGVLPKVPACSTGGGDEELCYQDPHVSLLQRSLMVETPAKADVESVHSVWKSKYQSKSRRHQHRKNVMHRRKKSDQASGIAPLQSQHSKEWLEHPLAKLGSKRRYAAFESQVLEVEKDGVTVIIPGLGTEARAANVEKNLQWLKKQNVPFECWIYVYSTEPKFPNNPSRFDHCKLIRHPGFWMAHVLALPLNITTKPWVLHMMDRVSPQPDVNLTTMTRTMVANNLGHAAPTFASPRHDHWEIMNQQPNHTIGRSVDFIELHMDLFSRAYFACLQDAIDLDNSLGLGMDWMLPGLCGGHAWQKPEIYVGGLGLMDHMTLGKPYHGSYDHQLALELAKEFAAKHPNIFEPRYMTLGELRAPS
jgi:hypothetical protein